MNNTKIQYLDKTLNVFTGCSPISLGCAHCWAKRMAARHRGLDGYPADDPFRPTVHHDRLRELWELKKPSRIGINFMSDTFHDDFMRMDANTGEIKELFMAMMRANWHTYFILTKRPQNMKRFFDSWIPGDIFMNEPTRDHIHLGVSVENQATADERIIPGLIDWVSYEPALGPVDLSEYLNAGRCRGCGDIITPQFNCSDGHIKTEMEMDSSGEAYPVPVSCGPINMDVLSWVVCGAETGYGARPMPLAWPRSLREQCRAAGVPFYFKSAGPGKTIPPDLRIREMPHTHKGGA